MHGVRLYSVALVCLVGLLGGCSHTTTIKLPQKSQSLVLKTVCVPAFTAFAAVGSLPLLTSDNADVAIYGVVGLLGAGVVDHLRCGMFPPSLELKEVEASAETGGSASTQSLEDTADSECLERACGRLKSMFTQSKYKECIKANLEKCQ